MRPPLAPRRYWVLSATLAALPDLDVIPWVLGVPNSSLFAHRAITHSLLFAVVAGGLAARVGFRGPSWASLRYRLWATFALATATHGLLDALTAYNLGIEFFAPFSQHRYRFAWQPITGRDWPWGVLFNETAWVLAPALVVGGGAWLLRRLLLRRKARATADSALGTTS